MNIGVIGAGRLGICFALIDQVKENLTREFMDRVSFAGYHTLPQKIFTIKQ